MELFNYKEALEINEARIKHLDSLKLNLKDKKILETGCGGKGDITAFLLSKGANVILNDARIENIKSNINNNPKIKEYNTWDLNNINYNCLTKSFDIIICYGTLYHLKNIEKVIQNFSKLCKDYIIISTCTNGQNNENLNMYEDPNTNNQAIDGIGCRPGRLYLYNNLKKNFNYVYTLKTQPKNNEFPLQFPSINGNNRCIFIGSHIEIKNDNFVDYLQNNYTY